MPNIIDVRVNPTDVARVKALLKNVKNGAPRAFMRTNNKMITTTKAKAAKEITSELTLKSAAIKANLPSERATLADSTSVVFSPQAGLLLGFYTARLLKKGFSVKILKAGSTTKFPEGYIIKNLRYSSPPYGGLAVQKNVVTDFRKPSRWLYGPSYSQAYAQHVEDIQFRRFLNLEQQKKLQQEVRYILSKV